MMKRIKKKIFRKMISPNRNTQRYFYLRRKLFKSNKMMMKVFLIHMEMNMVVRILMMMSQVVMMI